MKIIGLSGYARSGKDTVAEILVQQHGFERRAFADPLYEGLRLLNPIVGYVDERAPAGAQPDYHRLADLVEWHGWEALKSKVPDLRPLLQRLGTEVGRNLLGQNIWVEAATRNLNPEGKYVFTDCRFENEAAAVLARDGLVVRVRRPGYGPANNHISETGMDDWPFDVVIDNDRDLEHLADEVAGVLLSFDARSPVQA